MHGQNNTVSAFQGFLTGYNRTLSKSYGVIADGSGTDVHWARYDSTGKLVASSEPLTGGDAYAYAGAGYSLTKFNGVDSSKCALSVQQEGPDNTSMTDVASNYSGYVWARFYKTTPPARRPRATCPTPSSPTATRPSELNLASSRALERPAPMSSGRAVRVLGLRGERRRDAPCR